MQNFNENRVRANKSRIIIAGSLITIKIRLKIRRSHSSKNKKIINTRSERETERLGRTRQ